MACQKYSFHSNPYTPSISVSPPRIDSQQRPISYKIPQWLSTPCAYPPKCDNSPYLLSNPSISCPAQVCLRDYSKASETICILISENFKWLGIDLPPFQIVPRGILAGLATCVLLENVIEFFLCVLPWNQKFFEVFALVEGVRDGCEVGEKLSRSSNAQLKQAFSNSFDILGLQVGNSLPTLWLLNLVWHCADWVETLAVGVSEWLGLELEWVK